VGIVSIRDRLKKLEKNRPDPRPTETTAPARKDDLFFHMEQHRRAVEGRELLPAFVYSVEDQKAAALETLHDTIPLFSNTPGWSTPQGQELLAHWQAEAEQTIAAYHAGILEETDSTQMMILHDFGGALPDPTNDKPRQEDER
jgi:hypothetical protein